MSFIAAFASCVLILAPLAACNAASTPEGAGQLNGLPAMQRGPFPYGSNQMGAPGYEIFGDPGSGPPYP